MTTTFVSIPTIAGELTVELYSNKNPKSCKYFLDLVTSPRYASKIRFTERDLNPNCSRAIATVTTTTATAITTTSSSENENLAHSNNNNLSNNNVNNIVINIDAALSDDSVSLDPRQLFFGDEVRGNNNNNNNMLMNDSNSLYFSGAGLIGVSSEPNPCSSSSSTSTTTGAFFLTLGPSLDILGNNSVVVGRVVKGLRNVASALVQAQVAVVATNINTNTNQVKNSSSVSSGRFLNPLEILRPAKKFIEVTPTRPEFSSSSSSTSGMTLSNILHSSSEQQQQQKKNKSKKDEKKKRSVLDLVFE